MARTMGARIRELRLRAGITQSELASMIGETCKKQHICNWEKGYKSPGEKKIRDIARVFGVEPSYIRYGEGINND